jgi:hypothetical protein
MRHASQLGGIAASPLVVTTACGTTRTCRDARRVVVTGRKADLGQVALIGLTYEYTT